MPTKDPMNTYQHRQIGHIHWLLWAVAALAFALGADGHGDEVVVAMAAGVAFFALSLCFVWLNVRDGGDHLVVEFGPVSLFRKRVPYHEIDSVLPARSALIDGWGIHLVPGRGWTWNIWGRDCVELTMGTRRLRIGTDDPEGLAAFLRQRIGRGVGPS